MDGDADDPAQAPVLLRQCEGTLANVTADGAYDRDPVYQVAAAGQAGSLPEVVRRFIPGRRRAGHS